MSQNDDKHLKRKKLRTAFLLLILMVVIYLITVLIKQ
jgi:hypothetical protein